jgi:hypothetical protein
MNFMLLYGQSSLWVGQSQFDSMDGQEIFFFSKTSRPAIGPLQGYMRLFSLVITCLGHEDNHSSPSGATAKNE